MIYAINCINISHNFVKTDFDFFNMKEMSVNIKITKENVNDISRVVQVFLNEEEVLYKFIASDKELMNFLGNLINEETIIKNNLVDNIINKNYKIEYIAEKIDYKDFFKSCEKRKDLERGLAYIAFDNIDINKKNKNGETALMICADGDRDGMGNLYEYLLEDERLNFDEVDKWGRTALFIASNQDPRDNRMFYEFLFNWKGDVNITDKKGESIIFSILRMDDSYHEIPELIELYKEKGGKIQKVKLRDLGYQKDDFEGLSRKNLKSLSILEGYDEFIEDNKDIFRYLV